MLLDTSTCFWKKKTKKIISSDPSNIIALVLLHVYFYLLLRLKKKNYRKKFINFFKKESEKYRFDPPEETYPLISNKGDYKYVIIVSNEILRRR